MPLAQQTAAASLAMSIGILVVVALLLAWLWYERRLRGFDLSEQDAAHFASQDLRRSVVALLLGAVGLGIFADSWIEPRIGGHTNPLFLLNWLAVFILLCALPVLAVLDWLATRRYARRHFNALARERMDILREELRARSYGRGGTNGSPDSLGDSATS